MLVLLSCCCLVKRVVWGTLGDVLFDCVALVTIVVVAVGCFCSCCVVVLFSLFGCLVKRVAGGAL